VKKSVKNVKIQKFIIKIQIKIFYVTFIVSYSSSNIKKLSIDSASISDTFQKPQNMERFQPVEILGRVNRVNTIEPLNLQRIFILKNIFYNS